MQSGYLYVSCKNTADYFFSIRAREVQAMMKKHHTTKARKTNKNCASGKIRRLFEGLYHRAVQCRAQSLVNPLLDQGYSSKVSMKEENLDA